MEEEIFVEVMDKDINNNNIISLSPFQYNDLVKNEPFTRLTNVSKDSKKCELCHREFPSFSTLYKHQSKACYTDLGNEIKYPIEVIFPDWEYPLFEDFLREKNIPIVEKPEGMKAIVIDKDAFEIVLRQIYYSSITKYNLEQWYPPIEELGKSLGRSLTPKTIFVRLSDDDIKLIQIWSSINLSQVIGMEIRPTQDEQTKRENFEDKITEIMQQDGGGQKYYFCRLSTRSPKDGVSVRTDKNIEKNENEETKDEPKPETENEEPKIEEEKKSRQNNQKDE